MAGFLARAEQQGEGRADDEQLPQEPRVKFPSGNVEATQRAGLLFKWRPTHAWLLRSRMEYFSKSNADNVEGRSDNGFNVGIELNFNFKLSGRVGE